MDKWGYIRAIGEYDRTINNDKYGGLLIKLMEQCNKKSTTELTEDEVKDFYEKEVKEKIKTIPQERLKRELRNLYNEKVFGLKGE